MKPLPILVSLFATLLLTVAAQAGKPAATTTTPPAQQLDDMDKRAPVPLLPMMANHQKQNMRDHLDAVQQVMAGLAAHDFAIMEKGGVRLGFTAEMGQMCQHMGAGAPGFTEAALNFHHTADGIAAAARAKSEPGVITALNATLQTCVGCHAAYKQQVVDRATWEKTAAMKAPHH